MSQLALAASTERVAFVLPEHEACRTLSPQVVARVLSGPGVKQLTASETSKLISFLARIDKTKAAVDRGTALSWNLSSPRIEVLTPQPCPGSASLQAAYAQHLAELGNVGKSAQTFQQSFPVREPRLSCRTQPFFRAPASTYFGRSGSQAERVIAAYALLTENINCHLRITFSTQRIASAFLRGIRARVAFALKALNWRIQSAFVMAVLYPIRVVAIFMAHLHSREEGDDHSHSARYQISARRALAFQ